MEREKALALLKQHMKADNLIKHSIASEAVMKRVARKLGGDEDRYALAGLLHDIDVELTENMPEKHALIAMDLLPDSLPAEVRNAIKRHNEQNGSVREGTIDFALTASESLTGLVTAMALIIPDKKLSSVKASSIIKRMKEKGFARNVSREAIRECEKIGIPLPEFIEMGVESMKEISGELGL
ncbi:MAG: HDIG domain-containing protein [Candidatus Eremiobacteraeota bacterium]|nr:HDIG domain-containing protein [Candidatus Eremiobacteraeota bacterium]